MLAGITLSGFDDDGLLTEHRDYWALEVTTLGSPHRPDGRERLA
jgi:hypothetical protein